MFCFEAFACASMAIEACWRTWVRARLLDSAAKSASIMRPFATARLVATFCKLANAWSNRFIVAPYFPLSADMIDMALSIFTMYNIALSCADISPDRLKPPFATVDKGSIADSDIEIVSVFRGPIWNVAPVVNPPARSVIPAHVVSSTTRWISASSWSTSICRWCLSAEKSLGLPRVSFVTVTWHIRGAYFSQNKPPLTSINAH